MQEMAVIALLSYLSYLLADVLGLSAILSLFVCGVVVSHYALHNVSPEGRHATMAGFKTASYLAEGIIFIYVGMDALDPLKWQVGGVEWVGGWGDSCILHSVLLCSLPHSCWVIIKAVRASIRHRCCGSTRAALCLGVFAGHGGSCCGAQLPIHCCC
jgi:NhaP-type Na+/H+ or K+/H+ antiporter